MSLPPNPHRDSLAQQAAVLGHALRIVTAAVAQVERRELPLAHSPVALGKRERDPTGATLVA